MRIAIVATSLCLTVVGLASASSAHAMMRQATHIPPQSLDSALRTLAKERGFHIVYLPVIVNAVRTPGANGELTQDEALTQLLSGTGLVFHYLDDETVTVVPMDSVFSDATTALQPGDEDSTAKDGRKEGKTRSSDTFRVAQVDQGTNSQSSPVGNNSSAVQDGSKNGKLEEIVVTAQKRAESLDKVPISILAIDRAAMEQRNVYDISDVANLSPGVDYTNQGFQNSISIRGIYSASGYSTTGIYIDDVPVQIRSGVETIGNTITEPKVFDLDRVEILRGPQGTLFGAGAEGGIIRFITPEPSLTQASGYVRAGIATTDNGAMSYEAGAALGGPIVQDALGFRMSAWHRRDGGHIQHNSPVPGGSQYPNAGWSDSDVVRAALTFAPAENLKLTPSIYYQHIYFNDMPTFDPASSNDPGDTFTHNWHTLNPQYSNVGAGWFVNPLLLPQPSSDQFYLPALKIELRLANVDLTSSTSFMHRAFTAIQDWTTIPGAFLGFPWPTTANAGTLSSEPLKQNVFTEELRAQSADLSRRLQWTLGVFYTNSRQNDSQSIYEPYLPTQLPGTSLLAGDISYYGLEQDQDIQLAAFGQATYQLFRHVSVVAGARVAREETKYRVSQSGFWAGGASDRAGETSGHVTDPKFGINFQLNDDNLLYVSAAKGDRIGGVNYPIGNIGQCGLAIAALGYPNGVPPSYKPDWLWSYEVGAKSKLLSGRMKIEASAFHSNWSNVQYPLTLNACGGESFTSNLGKAVSNGFDFQTEILITDALKVGLSVGYTDAKYTSTIEANGFPALTNGEQINPYSSPWIIAPTIEYDLNLAGDYKVYARMDDTYRSRNPGPYQVPSNPNNPVYNPNFVPNPSINQLNLHLGMTWDGWDVSAYALNVTNSHPVLYSQQFQAYVFNGIAWTVRPLSIGATVNYRW